MDHYIGTLLDQRYEILENIGSGGMAFVYKARCNRLNRLVAVKILKQELLQDEDFRRRFHAESQAVAMMSHPNIVSVYDVSHSEHLDYIVMELIEGISLKQYMEQKKVLNWREALHFATQIAKALEHAHSRGIVHRDIKPHNIMILKDGSVKVADFGIAQMATAQNTLTREALGSVHYISPEQAKGAHVDASSDLYSLGVVLYEMLTGRPPFDGDTPVSVAIQHINAKAPLPHTINASVPIGLEQITMHAMTAERDARYTQASEMIHDLEEFRKNPNALFAFEDDQFRLTNEPAGQPLQPVDEHHGISAWRARRQPKQPQRAAADETDTRGGRIAVLAGVICIVLAFFGIAYFLYSYFVSDIFSRTEEDIVPNFIGAYYEDIDPSQYPNFKIVIERWTASETHEFGYVIDQTPAAERNAKVGTEIFLTVSSGAEGDIMPDLVNMTLQNALTCLNTMRISVTAAPKYEVSDVYTDGYVIRTEPQRDEPLIDGQTVVIYVSQGSSDELVQVPTLVGRTINEAKALIDAAGLSTGSALIVESEQPEGIVIFQGIAAREMVKKGTVVNLQISRGPKVSMKPKITSISSDAEVMQSEEHILRAKAEAGGDAALEYRWYVSNDAERENGVLVSEEATCHADTSQPGTYYYFCEVNNPSEEGALTYSDPICITVLNGDLYTEIILHVRMPSREGVYTVSVNVGEEQRIAPFELDMSQQPSREIEIPVLGSGVQTVSVYVDGELFDTQLIEFDSER